ncbi:hypothetical protein SAY86_014028 [Trapa natans]|uniref:histone acetyltransferase n=1 Tax=Trapa natans TaxID=22666 RepID=A0AAN7KXI9_TRANT|nr:hypothetical protein SAY86_014028 [Trapa natans]
MAQKHQVAANSAAEPKKRRRVEFSAADSGVDPNDCIKIFLVSGKEEVGAADNPSLNAIDLSNFFEGDGKIYGYQGLEVIYVMRFVLNHLSVWVNIISFHSFLDITYNSKSDAGKGITDLTSTLKKNYCLWFYCVPIFFMFIEHMYMEYCREMLKNGEILQKKISNEHGNNSDVIRMGMQNKATGQLYSRLVPLILLLVDGSNPIDVTDPSWEMYLIIKKAVDHSGNDQDCVVGFSAVYRFYCYPNGLRLQLGQILVLPPYQQKGYGRYLLEVLNDVAVKEEVYYITIEEPVEKLQHLRTCIDVSRFLNFDPIQNAVNATSSQLQHGKISKKAYIPRFLPPSNVVEDIRSIFKVNKMQLIPCWEILVYLGLDTS